MPQMQDVEQSVSDKTRAIVINSPQNPTGVVYDNDFLHAILDICRERDIWLISDEVYSCFVPPGTYQSPGRTARGIRPLHHRFEHLQVTPHDRLAARLGDRR